MSCLQGLLCAWPLVSLKFLMKAKVCIQHILSKCIIRKNPFTGNIRVYCRVRPSLPADGLSEPVASFDPFDDGVIFINSKGKSQKFNLDKVFSMSASQSQVMIVVCSFHCVLN